MRGASRTRATLGAISAVDDDEVVNNQSISEACRRGNQTPSELTHGLWVSELLGRVEGNQILKFGHKIKLAQLFQESLANEARGFFRICFLS